MKKIAQKILKLSAKLAIAKNKYRIVAITGSVGKTSAKKAISLVLSKKYNVLSSEEGYNTEFGLPLILIEKKVPDNRLKWFSLVLASLFLALKKKDYEFCILEMGADKPGDIEYLTDIAKPNIAIITDVSEAHLQKFKRIDVIASEKGDIVILNIDNLHIANMQVLKNVEKITFGKSSHNIQIIKQDFTKSGSLNYFRVYGKNIKISSHAVGEHILYAFASAIAVGISQNINLKDIVSALESFEPSKGRLNIIKGIKESIIIDDSYNANPTSMKNALDVLNRFKGKRKIAVLGNMNELGKYTGQAHEKIGRYLVGKCDILVTVGDEAKKYLVLAAQGAGMDKKVIFIFDTSVEAGDFLKKNIKKGDIILAKGSQNKVRMEKAVEEIMANPDDASKFLCRQSKEWRNK